MPNASKATVLVDLHPERVTFALARKLPVPLDEPSFSDAQTWTTEDFKNAPLKTALRGYLDAQGLQPREAAVVISVPGPVIEDEIRLPGLPTWDFGRQRLQEQLKLAGLVVVNDMVACSLALPKILLLGAYRTVGRSTPASRLFPVLTLATRPDLGAAALVPDTMADGSSDPLWLPIATEIGPVEVTSFPEHAEVIAQIPRAHSNLLTAHDVLSAKGLRSIYQAVVNDHGTEMPPLDELVKSPDEAARTTVDLWCSFLGSLARNLALAYGARGGIYLFGETVQAMLSPEQRQNHETFRGKFEIRGPTGTYLSDIPVYLVTHDIPIMEGLARLSAD